MLDIGCTEANFCKKICVGKLSPRSTQRAVQSVQYALILEMDSYKMGHQVLESEHMPANQAYEHRNQPMSSFSLTGHSATVSPIPRNIFQNKDKRFALSANSTLRGSASALGIPFWTYRRGEGHTEEDRKQNIHSRYRNAVCRSQASIKEIEA